MRVNPIVVEQPKIYTPVLTDWFEKSLGGVFVRPQSKLRYRIHIPVQHTEDTWLIKVHNKRCRLDGHVITPRSPECDPRHEYREVEADCGV